MLKIETRSKKKIKMCYTLVCVSSLISSGFSVGKNIAISETQTTEKECFSHPNMATFKEVKRGEGYLRERNLLAYPGAERCTKRRGSLRPESGKM